MSGASGTLQAPGFFAVEACWICGVRNLKPVHCLIFELGEYAKQDPGLAAYSGRTIALVRCGACGFTQPEALPTLPDFFRRMYDQRWSSEWITHEFSSGYKDLIFRHVLNALNRLVPGSDPTLLDIGAHVGRLLHLAGTMGWHPEGIELNPATAAFAETTTGFPVHRADAAALAALGRTYDAVTMIDVLEHIPDPVATLRVAVSVLRPGGWIAIKVPHGRNQIRKELLRGRLRPGYRPTIADNLVHVNHFTPKTLERALREAGCVEVRTAVAPPELLVRDAHSTVIRRAAVNVMRLAVYGLTKAVPGGGSAAALHLLAFGRRVP